MKIKILIKSLKVFRLKAAILRLQFVNLMMFNCSLLSKTCLNVCRPTSPILSLPGTSCKLLRDDPAVAQRWPSGALAVPPLPVSLGLPQSVPKTKQPMSEFLFKNYVNGKNDGKKQG